MDSDDLIEEEEEDNDESNKDLFGEDEDKDPTAAGLSDHQG